MVVSSRFVVEAADPEIWDMTRNPWLLLQSLSPAQLEGLSKDQAFVSDLRAQVKAQRESHQAKRWFGTAHANSPLKTIAYFSMEFGLSEALPIYSGGLGLLAGDQLKTASDLGVPLVGVGLLYQQGYFRQMIDEEGRQIELYPVQRSGRAARSRRCESTTATGSESSSTFPVARFGCASGRRRWDASSSICSIATTR